MGHRAQNSRQLVTRFLEKTFKQFSAKVGIIASRKAFKKRIHKKQERRIFALVCEFGTYAELTALEQLLEEPERVWNLDEEENENPVDPELKLERLSSAIFSLGAIATVDTNQERYEVILYLRRGIPTLDFFFCLPTKNDFGPRISIHVLSSLRWKTILSDGVWIEWMVPLNDNWYYKVYCSADGFEGYHGEAEVVPSAEGKAQLVLRNLPPRTRYIVHIQARNKEFYLTVPVDLLVKSPKKASSDDDTSAEVESILAGLQQLTLLQPGFEDEL